MREFIKKAEHSKFARAKDQIQEVYMKIINIE